MLQVESLKPPGHDTGHLMTLKSFHLQKTLWLYKLFMRLGACFGTILVMCTLASLRIWIKTKLFDNRNLSPEIRVARATRTAA